MVAGSAVKGEDGGSVTLTFGTFAEAARCHDLLFPLDEPLAGELLAWEAASDEVTTEDPA
jgi:hypothetical protein